MSRLQTIRAAAQQAAEAIASVLGVEVTIADEKLRRVAGTGHYAGTISDIPLKGRVFSKVLASGEGYIEDHSAADSPCRECEGREQCRELAQVCCPVKLSNKTIGVIALVAVSGEQRQALLEQRQSLFAFLHRMADLLASKVNEQERLGELETVKHQLETVFNTVQEGILVLDGEGNVREANQAAQQLIGLSAEKLFGQNVSALFADVTAADLQAAGARPGQPEVPCWLRQRQRHCVMKIALWTSDTAPGGMVATLQEMAVVKKIVSRYDAPLASTQILGVSSAMENVRQAAAMAARTSAAVLIRGESGTGKELVARALHEASDRKGQPFVAINCAAIPEHLLESELFGYEEGAFTGARRGGKPGKFELASGGTLLLDEIGDMPLPLQAKLLRVLQERHIERVGGTRQIQVDARIISATHRDLEDMVRQGEFRQDIYYRINVFPILIPPLRQRREDVPELLRHFVEKFQAIQGKPIAGIADDAYRILLGYDWPGNVRELENVLEYLVSIAQGGQICAADVLRRISLHQETAVTSQELVPLAVAERQLITAAVNKFGCSLEGKQRAAQVLGISKATLYRKLKEYANE